MAELTPNYSLHKPAKTDNSNTTIDNLNSDMSSIDTQIKGLADEQTTQDTRIDNLVSSLTVDSEVIDARHSNTTDETFASLGARLDRTDILLRLSRVGGIF